MLRMKLGVGVGWGGDDNVLCTCTHGLCYATSCFLHLHIWFVLRNIIFLALARMVGATQHHFPCTCTHGRCYATSWFLHLHTWFVLRNISFLALARMVGATQHHFPCTLARIVFQYGVILKEKRFVATLTQLLQEKKADCQVDRAPDSL